MIRNKKYYINLRNKFLPKKLKVIFILESPPKSGKYFYDPTGNINELLFRTMMKLINYDPITKIDGLKKFSKLGYFLIDSTYNQINKIENHIDRNRVIVANIPNFVNDIESILKNKRVKIILIKKNIYKILSGPLESIGYKVLNQEIPFPDPSQFKIFFEKMNYLKEKYKLP